MTLKALDLFCGAGGASAGLCAAGYDVMGVDIAPQPNYPYAFVQADAMTHPIKGYDLVWASPPCQRFSTATRVSGDPSSHPDLIDPVRLRLQASEAAWIIENVPGAPIRADYLLCGSMFGLALRRHRKFETSWGTDGLVLSCNHSRRVVGVYGHTHGERGGWKGMLPSTKRTWSEAMGIDWMTTGELAQAIPPAYSRFLAERVR